jgi:drug/metabolite transporter (DMT)-like permease
MQHDVIALALLTAAGWGASDPLAKTGMERGGTPLQVSLTVVFVSVVVYCAVLLARGVALFSHPYWVLGLFLATGLTATAIARLLSYTGVQRVGASISSATVNTRPVWAMLLAVVFLGEAVTAQGTIGIGFVVGGLVTLAFSKGGDISGWQIRDLLFPLAAALTFAAGNVARRYAFTATDISAIEGVAINEAAGLFGLLVYLLFRHGRDFGEFMRAPREAYAYFVGCGLLSALSLFTLFEALDRGQVVLVDPLSSPTSLFAILFTFIFLREVERVTKRLLLGAVLVIIGVVLITGPQVFTL